MKIIGLDVGSKRIGVAQVDSSTRIAIPVGFLPVDGSEWQKIAEIARLRGTNWFVIGLPRSNEGNETKQSLYARNFAQTLLQTIPDAKIRFQDESLTSVEAEERLKQRGEPYEKGDIDAEAATIILQDFVENLGNTPKDTEDLGRIPRGDLASSLEENNSTPITAVTSYAKKEASKITLTAKKAHHQTKKAFAWLTIPPIIVALVLVVITVALKVRDERIREREEYYAQIEAEDKAEVFNFTIRPGETLMGIKESLLANGYSSDEIEVAFSENYNFPFLVSRPENATLEGYLPGETFEFYKDASVSEILTKFLAYMGQIITENDLENAYASKGLSLYEGITLASVVQKEANPPDFPTVAQVFLTRLDYGWRLGSDVTVSYALDLIDPNRETYIDNQAALTVDSCYNTRLYTGLPCGPIASPSREALLSVAHPAETDYLYFLTGDDGMMYYSNTEAEHNANAINHCARLCQVSL